MFAFKNLVEGTYFPFETAGKHKVPPWMQQRTNLLNRVSEQYAHINSVPV